MGWKLELHQSEPSTETWLPWQAKNNSQRITAHPSAGLGGLCRSLGGAKFDLSSAKANWWQSPSGNVLKDDISHGNIRVAVQACLCLRLFLSVQRQRGSTWCFPARKMFCVGFIHPKWGPRGKLGEGGPGERGEPDVPWWFGLGWGW